ncbi:insulinase family protein [Agaribacter flavus]|uniref:Insulinase family protein n=1 Tax=Agaribacter flavus TaxID=1902781 RepID=A0ABV7FY85_9ALTE
MTYNNQTAIYTNKFPNSLRLAVEKQDLNDVCAISFSVRAGRYYETNQCFGFTHLLEHLIFSPNKDYPEIGYLQKTVERYGGQVNAWTHSVTCNFHLQCKSEFFIESLSILLNKMILPSFSSEELEREITAIDAEFSMKKRDERRRILSVQQTQTNPEHPFSRFTVGTAATFAEVKTTDLIRQLSAFHSRHFNANNITVGLSMPSDNYERLFPVIESLLTNTIPPGEALGLPSLPPIIDLKKQGHLIYVEPVLPTQALILSYILKKTGDDELDNLALTMLQHLTESKHSGGLKAAIAQICDIEQLLVSGGLEDNEVEEIQIKIAVGRTKLTPSLLAQIKGLVLAYFSFLQATQIEPWRFREKHKQVLLAQHFGIQQSALDSAIDMAEKMNLAHDDVAITESLHLSDPTVAIRLKEVVGILQQLRPTMYVFTDSCQYESSTAFYQVNYTIAEPPKTVQPNHCFFQLPSQNKYMPNSLRVYPATTDKKAVITWQKAGVIFKYMHFLNAQKPLGDIYISISCQSMFGCAFNVLVKKIWLESIQSYFTKLFSSSEAAGLYYRIYGHQHGICIHTSGFTEKQTLLILDLLNKAIAYKFTQDEFERSREKIKRKLSKSLLQKPVNRLISILTNRVHPNVLEPLVLLDGIESLKFESADQHQQKYFTKTHIESLLVGNWLQKSAEDLQKFICDRMVIDEMWKKPDITANIINVSLDIHDTSNSASDNALVIYHQVRLDNNKNNDEREVALALIMECLLSPIFFVEMRNVRQLGYAVGVGYKPINQQAGLVFYTQAPDTAPETIYMNVKEVIQAIIENYSELLESLSHVKHQVSMQVSEKPNTASAYARYIWLHFDQSDPLGYTSKLQSAIENTTAEDVFGLLTKICQGAENQIRLYSYASTEKDNTSPALKHKRKGS